jgi:hypothetical protein
MGQLVEFPLADGQSVVVEVAPEMKAGPVVRGFDTADTVTIRAHRTFEEALDRVRPAVAETISRIRAMADPPHEIHVQFGLNLHAEVGAFVAAASTTANFTVDLTWRRSV